MVVALNRRTRYAAKRSKASQLATDLGEQGTTALWRLRLYRLRQRVSRQDQARPRPLHSG